MINSKQNAFPKTNWTFYVPDTIETSFWSFCVCWFTQYS